MSTDQIKNRHYHFVGIAGVGMSSVAAAVQGCGAEVSGSDRYADSGTSLPVLDVLRTSGVTIVAQDGSGVRRDTRAVVVSTAIEGDNPDIVRATALGVPILHRSEMLAMLIDGKECIAIAGTCGKTTVTGMVGYLLEQLGVDPNVVNGGAVVNWRSKSAVGNARCGASDVWVIEADESDKSLLAYRPSRAVITNMSEDHFSLAETRDLFAEFAKQVERSVITGSLDEVEFDCSGTFSTFCYAGHSFRLNIPGVHNVENAVHAIELCRSMGFEVGAIGQALEGFEGIERRLECVGSINGVAVYDDYGHNPAKISAAWSCLSPHFEPLHVIWRPHGYGPLASMNKSLREMFADQCRPSDRLYILPVYYVGGTIAPVLDAKEFVSTLNAEGTAASYVETYDDLGELLKAEVRGPAAVICMGARDPELPHFARRLLTDLA